LPQEAEEVQRWAIASADVIDRDDETPARRSARDNQVQAVNLIEAVAETAGCAAASPRAKAAQAAALSNSEGS
jgi:hypothetical protein